MTPATPHTFNYQNNRPYHPHSYANTPNLHPRSYAAQNRGNDMNQFRILRVGNLAPFVNSTTLFNLFSQYGYILGIKIAYYGEQTEAYINYYEHSECQIARDFLNKAILFEKQMRVGLTKYIALEENELFERSDKVNEIFYIFLKENNNQLRRVKAPSEVSESF